MTRHNLIIGFKTHGTTNDRKDIWVKTSPNRRKTCSVNGRTQIRDNPNFCKNEYQNHIWPRNLLFPLRTSLQTGQLYLQISIEKLWPKMYPLHKLYRLDFQKNVASTSYNVRH